MTLENHEGDLFISKRLLHLLIRLYCHNVYLSFTAIFKTIVIWMIYTDLEFRSNNTEDIGLQRIKKIDNFSYCVKKAIVPCFCQHR